MIRHATVDDASRIAEILVYTKRINYRRIFQNDKASFGEMQVYPLAKEFIEKPDRLENVWVYDDEFVKGMIRINREEIVELYVDTFFQNEGIGASLIKYAIERMKCDRLWVLEKNTKAIQFYKRYGFKLTGEKKLEEGTTEYVIKMKREQLTPNDR